MSARVTALINARAGGITTQDACDALAARIRAASPGADVVFCEQPGCDVGELAREAVAGGAEIVVAGGGDGTVNAVASAVAATPAVLALLPLGTLNHFARDLGVPSLLEDALAALSGGQVIAVDVGTVNGRVFLNNSGLGVYPDTVALREQRRREGWRKWPAFAWAFLRALSRYRKLHLSIRMNGTQLRRATPIIFVGNNRYQTEGFRLGMRERIDEGLLSLVIPHPHHPLRLLWFALLALLGRHFERDDIEVLESDAFQIDSRHATLRVALDGEVVRLPTPLRYAIRPRALRVLVPRDGRP